MLPSSAMVLSLILLREVNAVSDAEKNAENSMRSTRQIICTQLRVSKKIPPVRFAAYIYIHNYSTNFSFVQEKPHSAECGFCYYRAIMSRSSEARSAARRVPFIRARLGSFEIKPSSSRVTSPV